MKESNAYTPGFFRSLVLSCTSTEFYARIKDIKFMRSVGFLLLFSLLVGIIAFIAVGLFLRQNPLETEKVMTFYDDRIPSFTASFDGGNISTDPSQYELHLGVNSGGGVEFLESSGERTFFSLHVDTDSTLDEIAAKESMQPGVYASSDGIYVGAGSTGRRYEYGEVPLPQVVEVNKESFRPFFQAGVPIALDWIESILQYTLPLLVLSYSFFGNWFLAIFFSIFGILTLLIMRKPISYKFLIQLSFYAAVPSFLIMMLTHLLTISVSFIPVFIYAAFYYYGLWAYR